MRNKNTTRRTVLRSIAAGATAVGLGTAGASAGSGGRYIVGLEPGANVAKVRNEATSVRHELDFGKIGTAVAGEFPEPTVQALENAPGIRYVEPDGTVQAHDHAVPEDEGNPSEEQVRPWGIDRVDAYEPQHDGFTGDGSSIAIIDTGIDPEHETLEVAGGEAFVNCAFDCAEDWDDDHDHGTHVAGTANGANNDIGVIGVSTDAEMYAVKVLDSGGSGSFSDVAAGIEWTADQGIDVANLSLGGPSPSETLEDAVNYAYEQGTLVVSSAGNDGCCDSVGYPAAYENSLAISATDENDNIASFSSRGEQVELAAPGVNTLSSVRNDGYSQFNGTSMAAPHVAGTAAQVMALGIPNADDHTDLENPGGARGILRDTAEDIGLGENEQGYGLVDTAAALDAVDLDLSVETLDPSPGDTFATLRGDLRGLGDADDADVWFEYREVGSSSWTQTPKQTFDDRTNFDEHVGGLDPETDYEVRTQAETSEDTDEGDIVTFTTAPDHLAVETGDAEDVDWDRATLNGRLVGLGDADDADVFFEYREQGTSSWSQSASETVDDFDEEFAIEIAGLDGETDYEFRAVAEADGEVADGSTETFTTLRQPTPPVIEQFDITDETGSGTFDDPEARVDWTVELHEEAPAGVELDEVRTELYNRDVNRYEDEVVTSVSGESASGTHHLDGDSWVWDSYTITLYAVDTEGDEVEESKDVTLGA